MIFSPFVHYSHLFVVFFLFCSFTCSVVIFRTTRRSIDHLLGGLRDVVALEGKSERCSRTAGKQLYGLSVHCRRSLDVKRQRG